MQSGFKQLFSQKWAQYFPTAPLPIAFYYTDSANQGDLAQPDKAGHCLIHELERVRLGESIIFTGSTIYCGGGKRYLGYSQKMAPNFRYFLSCGIPGEMEGERYKESPELVDEVLKNPPTLIAPAKHIVFKRWDRLAESDEPLVVIFFATADVLAGLFTLANYDQADALGGVISPFGSGCSSIVQAPYFELKSDHPRAVLGMFDVSARPYVPSGELTLAVPWTKFTRMVENMDESFLITGSWEKVKARINKS